MSIEQSELATIIREAYAAERKTPELGADGKPVKVEAMANDKLAYRFKECLGARLIWDSSIGAFWMWKKSGYYVALTDPDSLRSALSMALQNWKQRGITMGKIDDILSQVRLMVRRTDDLDDEYIAFDDCLWSPETGTQTRPDPANIATLHVPVAFPSVATAGYPMFDKYLHETCLTEDGVFDQGMYDQLQEFAGYLLWPRIETGPCLFFYGEGSNGKSVFVDVMRGLVGTTRTKACGLEQLIGDKFGLSSLVGIRFNASDEMGNCRETTTQNFKKMVFGETVNTQRKFGDAFDFNPKCKFIFNTNRIPAFSEVNMAIKRRILIIPFYRTLDPFSPEGRKATIKHLGKLIAKQELPGVVRWAMTGLERLRANDFWFTRTEASEKMARRFEAESSSVIEFLAEHFEADPSGKLRSEDVYEEYSNWCGKVGRKATSRLSFSRDLGEVFGKSVPIAGVRVYRARRKGSGQPTLGGILSTEGIPL